MATREKHAVALPRGAGLLTCTKYVKKRLGSEAATAAEGAPGIAGIAVEREIEKKYMDHLINDDPNEPSPWDNIDQYDDNSRSRAVKEWLGEWGAAE